jgi:NAD-dependent SIR2 family protein deacetylase
MSEPEVDAIIDVLRGRRVCLLTGAGMSTASGIPDYRGPQTKDRPRNPIQHRAFIEDAKTRARYWARSTLGWPRFRAFEPNEAHRAVATWQRFGQITGLITQNVDRLHHKAGSEQVIELHGALFEVRCLACGALEPRDALQLRILEANPSAQAWAFSMAPDGDADIPDQALEGFQVPACVQCGGVLKPDVVFFGDNVPAARVEHAFAALAEAQALMVIGSSLAVYSGYRFVLKAAQANLPIVLVNLGESRGDAHATVRAEVNASLLVPTLVERLLRA